MKTKKALAVLLAVVMLVMPLAVSSFAAESAIITNPEKTDYNDSEYFNPQGLVIVVDGEEIVYTPTDAKFRFDPALNELLAVETKNVAVYYDNSFVGTVTVTVNHILGDIVCIDKGHGRYCLGCGTLHQYEAHTVNEWVPNDDGGIFIPQTMNGVCEVCNATVTENLPNSEKFLSLFDKSDGAMTEFEGQVMTYFYAIVVTLVQMLVGLN